MRGYFRSERGSSAAEYAILLAILGGAVGLAMFGLGGSISNSLRDSSELFALADDTGGGAPSGDPGAPGGGGGGGGSGGSGGPSGSPSPPSPPPPAPTPSSNNGNHNGAGNGNGGVGQGNGLGNGKH